MLLGHPSRCEVRAWAEAGATYPIIWERLCAYFGKDLEESTRVAWENLSLDFRGKLSSTQWRQFAANFVTLMRRTPGASENEGLRLLRRQLPAFLGERLEKEKIKREKSGGGLLGIAGLNVYAGEASVYTWLQTVTGQPPARVLCQHGQFWVDSQNDVHRQSILGLNGKKLQDGSTIVVTLRDPPLTVASAISLIGECINVKEMVEEARSLNPHRGREQENTRKNSCG